MKQRPPRTTRTDTLFPYTALFRSRGLTQVVATDGAIPRRSAHSLFVSTTVSLSVARTSASPSRLSLSQTPVRDTPRRRSSSHVSFHFFLRYLKSVKEACIVPIIADRQRVVSGRVV